MNPMEAYLIVRMHETLMEEGRGIYRPHSFDGSLIAMAAEMCIDMGYLTVHEAWDLNLVALSDPRHEGCRIGGCRPIEET